MTTGNSKTKAKNDDKLVNTICLVFTLMFLAAPIISIFQGSEEGTEDVRQKCFDSTRDKVMVEMQESGNTTIDSVSEINAITRRFDHCN